MNHRRKYPHLLWRPFFDIILCYAVIAGAIALSLKSFYFYPLSVLIIANRILTLSLLCHEALHGNLFKNAALNNFAGRWFCAFPTFISLSKYRKLHLLHHRVVAHPVTDPDYHLYQNYPMSKKDFFWNNFLDVVTLKSSWKFIQYYTEIPDHLFAKEGLISKFKKNKLSGDFREFLFFYVILFSGLIALGWFNYYLLFFSVPLVFITQPYVLLMGGLQHGPVQQADTPELLSRSIRGPKIVMEMLLPLNINYHAEHHLNSTIPHYWLKSFAQDMEENQSPVWKTNYQGALKDLFN